MTEPSTSSTSDRTTADTAQAKVSAESLRLHARQPPATRFNRHMVRAVVIGVVALVVLAFYLGFGQSRLSDTTPAKAPDEKPDVQATIPVDSFQRLPKGYSEVRHTAPVNKPDRLGPRLDGDMGPVQQGMEERLLAELCAADELPARACRVPQNYPPSGSAVTEVEKNARLQRLKEETDALKAGVFFATTGQVQTPSTNTDTPQSSMLNALSQLGSAQSSAAMDVHPDLDSGNRESLLTQNNQAAKQRFLRDNPVANAKRDNPYRLQRPVSPYVVQAGSVIPCVLLSGLNSDLPGDVTCQVREPVYDTPTGQHLLIPQGTKVLGTYDSSVTYGQSRVLLVWRRLLFPDGSSLPTGAMPAVDLAGYAGLSDNVNHHYGRLVGGILAASLLNATTHRLRDDEDADSGFQAELLDSAGANINRAGQKITQKNLDIQPTHEIRPGWSLNILVNQDVVLQPYTANGR